MLGNYIKYEFSATDKSQCLEGFSTLSRQKEIYIYIHFNMTTEKNLKSIKKEKMNYLQKSNSYADS